MMPTAHQIAVAIVAASRETGADPVGVIRGVERDPGKSVAEKQAITRARAYAARAMDRVFNRPEIAIRRSAIARYVGANKPSWESYFATLDCRPLGWWSNETFKRVVDAVMDCEPPQEQFAETAQAPTQANPPNPPPASSMAQRLNRNVARDPERRSPIGTLEAGGFRPAPGTYEKVLRDDRPPRTNLDRFVDREGRSASYHAGGDDQLAGRAVESRKCRDLLAEAAANTRALQEKLPPEPDD